MPRALFPRAGALLLAIALQTSPVRRSEAEERIDFKTLIYQEDDDRIRVIAPAIQVEKKLSDSLTIRIEGIYNSISGATPTGAPPSPVSGSQSAAPSTPSSPSSPAAVAVVSAPSSSPPVVSGDDDDDDEFDHRFAAQTVRYVGKAGATPAATPPPSPTPAPASSPSTTPATSPASSTSGSSSGAAAPGGATGGSGGAKVPRADFNDIRYGFNLELIKELDRHTLSGMYSYSYEDDYVSHGLALRDAINFNKKNTTLTLGGALTHDQIDPVNQDISETKDSLDIMVGVTQVLDKKTLFTANLTLGLVDGYIDDPYKVAELNGVLVPESRPDTKTKQIIYLALTRFFESVNGSSEISFRRYSDDFGIDAYTFGLAWYQKFGPNLVIRPAIRYYTQDHADFYGVRFSGSPEHYSSDYRLSAFDALGYGIKAIWQVNENFALDAAVDRYVQDGTDSLTSSDVYPSATAVTIGARISW
ncbi:MAG: DUF3570 domain-containing protein [Verrucomicrobia bacterium]|nr:DUF3570 domain-containing protein [Verrucomicrobiota bacterium]